MVSNQKKTENVKKSSVKKLKVVLFKLKTVHVLNVKTEKPTTKVLVSNKMKSNFVKSKEDAQLQLPIY